MTGSTANAIETPFYQFHLEAGARMVEFAGYLMPIQYEGITAEHLAVRNNIGLFDLSHMGEFTVSGLGAVEFLQRTTTNDVAALEIGQIQYTCMTYPDGGIVDDLLLYRMGEHDFFLVVNASNIDKDFDWLQSNLKDEVELTNVSNSYGLLAIQGPNAQKVMQKLSDYPLEDMPYYTHATTEVAGVKLLFSRTGYTGEDGFELYIPNDACAGLWTKVMEAGQPEGIKLIGLGARDTLRLEMKMALYGNDIDQTTSPIEAGLGWIVNLDKQFIGHEVIARQKEEKPNRRLICLEMDGRLVPRHGFEIFDGDNQVGTVTSGTFSPSLERPVALAYVKRSLAKIGTTLEVSIRNRRAPATVVKPPFYKNASHR